MELLLLIVFAIAWMSTGSFLMALGVCVVVTFGLAILGAMLN